MTYFNFRCVIDINMFHFTPINSPICHVTVVRTKPTQNHVTKKPYPTLHYLLRSSFTH